MAAGLFRIGVANIIHVKAQCLRQVIKAVEFQFVLFYCHLLSLPLAVYLPSLARLFHFIEPDRFNCTVS